LSLTLCYPRDSSLGTHVCTGRAAKPRRKRQRGLGQTKPRVVPLPLARVLEVRPRGNAQALQLRRLVGVRAWLGGLGLGLGLEHSRARARARAGSHI